MKKVFEDTRFYIETCGKWFYVRDKYKVFDPTYFGTLGAAKYSIGAN